MAIKLKTTEQRSRQMARIGSKDTKPELALRKALREAGLTGYRKNLKGIPGTPDVAFTKYKLAVFVDGEYWHGKDFEAKRERLAAGNNGTAYWVPKIEANMARDRRNEAALEAMGWHFVRFWGKDVEKDAAACARVVAAELEALERGA